MLRASSQGRAPRPPRAAWKLRARPPGSPAPVSQTPARRPGARRPPLVAPAGEEPPPLSLRGCSLRDPCAPRTGVAEADRAPAPPGQEARRSTEAPTAGVPRGSSGFLKLCHLRFPVPEAARRSRTPFSQQKQKKRPVLVPLAGSLSAPACPGRVITLPGKVPFVCPASLWTRSKAHKVFCLILINGLAKPFGVVGGKEPHVAKAFGIYAT